MGAGVAAGQHTEQDAEGHAVEGAADEVVVAQNEQTVYAHIHQEGCLAIGGGEAGGLGFVHHQCPVVLGGAAHGQGNEHQHTEHNQAEGVCRSPGGNRQGFGGRCGGQGHAHGLIQHGLEEEGSHAHRHGGVVQVISLVHLGGMGQTGGEEEANDQPHEDGQSHPGDPEAHSLGVGIAHHQLGNQGSNAGGEQHGIDVGAALLPLYQAVEHHAQNAGPHVQHIYAPGGKAQGQQEGQGGYIVGHGPEEHIQCQTEQGHKPHVQEGGRIAAYGKIVGGDFAGLADNLPKAGKHIAPVRHHGSSHQKGKGEEAEEQL